MHAHKKSHATRIVLNMDFMALLSFYDARAGVRLLGFSLVCFSEFPYQRKYTLPYEKGDDAIYPPRQVSAEE